MLLGHVIRVLLQGRVDFVEGSLLYPLYPSLDILLRIVGAQSSDALRLYVGVDCIHECLLLDVAVDQLDFLDFLPDFIIIWEVNQLQILQLNELMVGEKARKILTRHEHDLTAWGC